MEETPYAKGTNGSRLHSPVCKTAPVFLFSPQTPFFHRFSLHNPQGCVEKSHRFWMVVLRSSTAALSCGSPDICSANLLIP